ncbi:MAG TPA: 16S rRNA (guanine(527)-N(7))-methyltransferase RsmG [Thermohalobaculum sp.]|nr:16S rRNA (guanine(527)-N(7))-methyltransferase RsmG [Thermohalobaculum sp.]
MTPAQFCSAFGVSRETAGRLALYVNLLKRWNARINLVAPASLNDVWSRHIADSAQLVALAPAGARSWIDLGSGGGLPGLPVAALAAEVAPGLRLTLIESDRRKAAFLATAAREMCLDVTVLARRIEALPARPYDVVSARALAPLDRLCALAHRFKGPRTVFLFPKGARLDLELTAAATRWHIHAERIASRTNPEAAVLRIVELEPHT